MELIDSCAEIDTTKGDASTKVQGMGAGMYLLTGLPDWIDLAAGRDIREFDPATWRLWPISKRVELGFTTIDPRQKLVGEELKLKSQLELMRDGLIETPRGYTVEESTQAADGLELVAMTITEMVAAGQITQAEADAQTAAEVRARRDELLQSFLGRIQRYETQLKAGVLPTEAEAAYKALLGALQPLRDIPQEPSFPYQVTWPETV